MEKEKKNITKEQKLSAEHIKSYRTNDRHMTQEEFADLIGREKQMVARYEKGRTPIPPKVIERLVCLSGWIKEYWEGLTDCQNWDDFAKECETAELENIEIIRGYKERRQNQIKNLLSLCGFGYENYSEGSINYDYLLVSNSPKTIETLRIVDAGFQHKIILRQNDRVNEAFLNDTEMSALLSDLSDFIAFRCYQKSQRIITASLPPSILDETGK